MLHHAGLKNSVTIMVNYQIPLHVILHHYYRYTINYCCCYDKTIRPMPCHCCCHDKPVRRCLYGRGSANTTKRLWILPDSHCPGTHLLCQQSQQSNADILLSILDKREV